MVKKQVTKTKAQGTKGQGPATQKSKRQGPATQKTLVVSVAKSGPFQKLPEDVRAHICGYAEDPWHDQLKQLGVPDDIISLVCDFVHPAL